LRAPRRLVASGEATAERAAEGLADEPVPLLSADARLARAVAGHADLPVLLADCLGTA
jgi:hypothetical protein